jgi:hypothetical protein
VEYLFLEYSQEPAPPVTPAPATLLVIDNAGLNGWLHHLRTDN